MIRKGEEKDIEIIAEYNCRMALETEDLKLDKEKVLSGVRHAVNDPTKAEYYLHEIEGQVVGQLMITKEWSDWRDGYFWWIQSVYVHKDYRCQGVFKSLYRYVKNIVKRQDDVCGLRLYVDKDNIRAQETYKSLGMENTDYLLYENLIR